MLLFNEAAHARAEISEDGVNRGGIALYLHANGPVRFVANPPGDGVSACAVPGRGAEANALDAAGEGDGATDQRLRHGDGRVEVHVLDRIQQFDAVLHGPLEGLAA